MPLSGLAEFVAWVREYIVGDEKSEAQIFLDRLFRAFDQKGVLEAGGRCEFRVRKLGEDDGGVSFADLAWKPIVLFEMKRRGTPLQRHYRQAFDYWTYLVPNRPRYVVLSDFFTFWVYDFETQMDSPKDIVTLDELPERWGPLAFLLPDHPQPTFGNDREAVTRRAANQLAFAFDRLIARRVERPVAQRFILQFLVALFGEDIGLLPKYLVARLLDDCATPADAYDLIGGLFEQMNNPRRATGGRFMDVPYFDGGLFAEPARLELEDIELVELRKAAAQDWGKVQPDIFGTLFEASLGAVERHAFGAHFTHPADIMKIVGPTIVEPWREQIEGAKTLRRLRELRDRLHHFRVLDPACGSGNFLYIAYRELKRLEARLYERLGEFPSQAEPGQLRLSFLSAQNFFGIDINPFAVELAKVTMMIARKLAIDELHITEPALPLDNLDANFRATDALLDPDGQPAPWPAVDVIVGNPPFLGSRYFAKEHGYEYVRRVHAAFPDVPKMADFCVYWLRKAAEHLPVCTIEDPLAGRAGLVGTQNIRNNESRQGGLDYVVRDGTIVEAVDNQPWSGEANVHVSVVNWVKTQVPTLVPHRRRLWFKVALPATTIQTRRRPGSGPASKDYQLAFRDCDSINASLSDATDVADAVVLDVNARPKRVFTGQNPCHEGFKCSSAQAQEFLWRHPEVREVLFPYMTGADLVTEGTPSRWIVDFGQRGMLEAAQFADAFARIKALVLPDVLLKAAAEKSATGKSSTRWTRMAERWWQFRDPMPGTVEAIEVLPRYVVCPRVTKRPTFAFVSRLIRPDMQLMVFAFADDYSFGVLQSAAHWQWFVAKCSKLKADFRYTGNTVFDTFPWPQFPDLGRPGRTSAAAIARIHDVAQAAREIRRLRAENLRHLKGGLRALYRTLELPGANPLKDAHARLDMAVLAAYGFDPQADLLAQLLELNRAVAVRLGRGEPVTPPGVPPGFPDAATLVTADCIEPPSGFGPPPPSPPTAPSPVQPVQPSSGIVPSQDQADADAAHYYAIKDAPR